LKTPQRIRVLVAEDDVLVGEMVRAILEEAGYEVAAIAANGLQAVELTQQLQPDVLLTDIRMPDMDGLEAVRLIQKQRPTSVVVLSAYETPELVKRASEVGVGAYLLKPPDIPGVDRAITIALARFADMKELRQLNADLDAYAHTVAHDLKNPLSTVVSAAEYLAAEYSLMSQSEIDTYLQLITQSGLRMREIVDSLLLLAEVRDREVQLQPLDMGQIVREVCQQLWWMCKAQPFELIVPESWPLALGHGPWVQSVWANYLSNAFRYGGQPPRVELGATEQPDSMVRFWVRDNGHGIPPDQREHIFDPFVRLEPQQRGGHGLGLSIVHRIVQKLGGQVGVDSKPGQGSVFYFTLPTKK